ncbi:MAG: hypothetical protein MN733_38285, partial [Nitrososphaera sp.]|nr:hypothetical protein [Nitrososphaera sp.]
MPSPSIAIAGQVTGIKSLFAKFEQINDPLISSFAGSMPETFPEIVEHISSRNVLVSDFILQNRTKLRSLVQKFHTQAGTSTPGVENSIALLSDPTTQILVSTHQPNLFPYGGILKKIVLLEALKESIGRLNGGKKIVNLFIVVDHDFVDETWIRQAQMPSIKHSSGIMELRLPVKDSKRWQMVCNVALPARYLLNHWKLQVRSWIRLHTGRGINCDKRTLMANLEDFWQRAMVPSYSRASSYADLNSFALSKLANEVWNYSTIFVRLSEMSSVFENGFAFLIANHA